MYSETTRGIQVSVRPIYLDAQSEPADNRFVWAYFVRIENLSGETVQLRKRSWQIIDQYGRKTEIDGAGVVGEEPILRPGQVFEYSSGAPLEAPSGIMSGQYEMETKTGERFPVTIPPFSLDSPYGLGARH
jgi:ApaG protein